MKVIYILHDPIVGPLIDQELIDASNSIKIGAEYTVVGEWNGNYELEEFPCKKKNDKIFWDKNCFVPAEEKRDIVQFVFDEDTATVPHYSTDGL